MNVLLFLGVVTLDGSLLSGNGKQRYMKLVRLRWFFFFTISSEMKKGNS